MAPSPTGSSPSLRREARDLLLVATGAVAQQDSLAKAAERQWLRPATDGRLWHERFLLDRAAPTKKTPIKGT
jgi:hypothetical protein